jgi:hypothetical protein
MEHLPPKSLFCSIVPMLHCSKVNASHAFTLMQELPKEGADQEELLPHVAREEMQTVDHALHRGVGPGPYHFCFDRGKDEPRGDDHAHARLGCHRLREDDHHAAITEIFDPTRHAGIWSEQAGYLQINRDAEGSPWRRTRLECNEVLPRESVNTAQGRQPHAHETGGTFSRPHDPRLSACDPIPRQEAEVHWGSPDDEPWNGNEESAVTHILGEAEGAVVRAGRALAEDRHPEREAGMVAIFYLAHDSPIISKFTPCAFVPSVRVEIAIQVSLLVQKRTLAF